MMLHMIALLLGITSAEVYFKETFDTDPLSSDRWIQSNWKSDSGEYGKWEWSAGEWSADDQDTGLRTSQDAKFYAITSKLPEPFHTGEADQFVVQFSVKHEQKIDCGGGYIKLLGPEVDVESFNRDTKYGIMFGPDICGSTKKVHAIFNYKGEYIPRTTDIKCVGDEFTHVYTLTVRKDGTYEIRIDNEEKASGELKDDWDFEIPKRIKDPEVSKPEDWVDEMMMDDPEDVKPEGWDDEPATIPDPDAEQPEDWDEEDDGEWEAPQIVNPKYKGEWNPKRIPHPGYKGEWIHPMIDNPDYVEEDVYKGIGLFGYIGFELWQVKAGSIFDNIILTDSIEEAEAFFAATKIDEEAEKKAKEAYEEAQKPVDEEAAAFDAETKIDEEAEKKAKEAYEAAQKPVDEPAEAESGDEDYGDVEGEDERDEL